MDVLKFVKAKNDYLIRARRYVHQFDESSMERGTAMLVQVAVGYLESGNPG